MLAAIVLAAAPLVGGIPLPALAGVLIATCVQMIEVGSISRLEKRGIIVLLSGIRPAHDDILATLGVADHLRADHRIFADTPAAIASARVLVGKTPR